MKQLYTLILFFFIIHPNESKAQCFECIKTYGSLGYDFIRSLEVLNNGFVSITSDESSSIRYYDNNCNLIWKKNYVDYNEEYPYALRYDKEDNLYVYEYTFAGSYEGKNITKFDKNGKQLWEIIFAKRNRGNHPLNAFWNAYLMDYKILNNKLYIIGYFTNVLIFNGEVIYDFRSTDNHTNKNYFISEFDLNGKYKSTKIISRSNGGVIYRDTVLDEDNNLYLIMSNYQQVILQKYDSELNLSYSKIISQADYNNNINITTPQRLFYSKKNNKILLFSSNAENTNLGNEIIKYEQNDYFNRHLLIGINPKDGTILNYKKLDFIPHGKFYGDSELNPSYYYFDYLEAYDKEFILTNFNREININGEIIKPKISKQSEEYGTGENDTNLILFNFKSNTLDLSPLLYTNTGSQEPYLKMDIAKFVRALDKDNLLISGEFQSLNFEINNIHITNKSINGEEDYFIYKYNLNNKPNNISININNTCFGEATKFSAIGEFDSIKWEFGDSETSNSKIPLHVYKNPGKYNIKAIITCKNETREFYDEVNIQKPLNLEKLDNLTICENNSYEGIGIFDTSTIPNLLTKNQNNYTLKFYDINDIEIIDFISKTYQNKTPFNEKIIVKGYFNDNPNCISETSFLLQTSDKSELPILKQDLKFCIGENIKFQDLLIEGKKLKYYDENNNIINSNNFISSGKFYVSQTQDLKCESNKLELIINIINTVAPNAENNQVFCLMDDPTLNSIKIEGENINWYESETSNIKLNPNTPLLNNKIYYASQSINNCESLLRTPILITLSTYTLLTSTPFEICKNEGVIGQFNLSLKSKEIGSILGVNENNIQYFETLDDAKNKQNILSNIYTNNSNKTSIFAISTSNEKCKTYIEIPLIENINPIISINEAYTKCKNTPIEIELNQSFKEIIWSTGERNIEPISIINPGKYSVTVSNESCTITKKFEIKDYNDLNIEYKYDGKMVTFASLNDLSIQYSLDGYRFSTNPTFILETGEYTFYFKSVNGCIETKKIYLYKDIPNTITPNGDGKNDNWNLSYIKNLDNVKVFDRKGMIIFQADKTKQPIIWDGKYQLKTLPTDTYWYIIKLENNKIIQGSILIKNK